LRLAAFAEYQADMVNQRSGSSECGINGAFDLDAAITNLLKDEGSRSLELPCCLTPEQRNKAKLVAGQYPELKCESYGFGSDRRLHIFKRSATTCVRVKNTFVDGWDAPDDDEKHRDAIIFRSEPRSLWERAPLYSPRKKQGNGKLELPPLCRTIFSTPTTPDDSDPDTPEGASSSSDELVHSPISPSSMTTDIEERQEPPKFPPGRFDILSVGTLVVIQGLVRAPAFNGRVGVVHSLDAETGRYTVLLASPSCGQQSQNQRAKVKYENLRKITCIDDCSTSCTAA
jgi:hypothetical protein